MWSHALIALPERLNHFYGVKRSGRAMSACDHIHYAPLLRNIYGWAEAKLFDPYEIGMKLLNFVSAILMKVDRAIDWLYSKLAVLTANVLSLAFRKAHTGAHWMYVLWMLAGGAAVVLIIRLV